MRDLVRESVRHDFPFWRNREISVSPADFIENGEGEASYFPSTLSQCRFCVDSNHKIIRSGF